MPDGTTIDFDSLLTKVDALMRTMHVVRESFSLPPTKDHIGTCISYSDLIEMRPEFIRELKSSATAFVYSVNKQQELLQKFRDQGRDEAGAWEIIADRAKEKFRPGNMRGQLSELLLSNFLQHYFRAVPLLRKMPITTNPRLERNGADAIHIRKNDQGEFTLYLGEAKTIHRRTDSFKGAIVESVDDIVKHYQEHRNELYLYTYEDFLPPELEGIATAYIEGSQKNITVELVCIATYNCKNSPGGKNEREILESIIESIRDEAKEASSHPVFARVPQNLLPRLNYILFSVSNLNRLIEEFEEAMGHGN